MLNTDFAKCKAVLERKQAELARAGRKLDALAVQRSADLLEEIQLASEREMAILTADRDAHLLRQVRAALERLADGSYGVCQRCEESIPPRRLEALPWAAHCVTCQEALDRGGDEEAAPLPAARPRVPTTLAA